MQKLFMPATSFMKSRDSRGDWLPPDVNYYELQDHPTYVTDFAAKICKQEGNIVPAIRASAWNTRNLCQGHFDKTNGKRVETEPIACVNCCEDDFQI